MIAYVLLPCYLLLPTYWYLPLLFVVTVCYVSLPYYVCNVFVRTRYDLVQVFPFCYILLPSDTLLSLLTTSTGYCLLFPLVALCYPVSSCCRVTFCYFLQTLLLSCGTLWYLALPDCLPLIPIPLVTVFCRRCYIIRRYRVTYLVTQEAVAKAALSRFTYLGYNQYS